jgi:hypothetical protein
VAPEVPQHPFSHGVLEALQEFVGESGGFVEAEVGLRGVEGGVRGLRGGLDLLEEPVHDAKVVVVGGIEGGAEAVGEAYRHGERWT